MLLKLGIPHYLRRDMGVTIANADAVLKEAYAGYEKASKEEEEYRQKNKQKTQMQIVKEEYDKKIQWYIDKIIELDKSRDSMINQIKKNQHSNIQSFIHKAERNGIDRMNHETIIDMLKKQYCEWFGDVPLHLSVPEYRKIDLSSIEVL